MELKDVILSTLEEIEEYEVPLAPEEEGSLIAPVAQSKPLYISELYKNESQNPEEPKSNESEEIRILDGIRERLLVLFEGFQSPNNVQIEAKVDLTLNFFEYLLATIDTRLHLIKDK